MFPFSSVTYISICFTICSIPIFSRMFSHEERKRKNKKKKKKSDKDWIKR